VTDVLLVSIGVTSGARTSARVLADGLERAGASVTHALAARVPAVRTFALTDFVQARAARRAAARAIAERRPDAIIYSSVTAALLWPAPGAIWLDGVAALNRPGRHGLWQRPLERRRIAAAPLVIEMAAGALAPLRRADAVVLPTPVEPSGASGGARDLAAVTYAGDPGKRRLDAVLAAWDAARHDGEELVVAGVDGPPAPGVRFAGLLAPDEFRALLRRARVFVTAPVREEFGIAALEALADGCMLVTTPAVGVYPAFEIARELDPRLVGQDVASGLRAALDSPADRYAERAAELLVPYGRDTFDRTVAREILPRLFS
jgi:glycosyltransferase involved in cell wall biosynthesis